MNAKQLSKNVGQLFRFRPVPFRMGTNGEQLPQLDDQWRLDEILANPVRIRLTNIRTAHQLVLEADNIMERRSPDFLMLRCEVTIRPHGVDIEPIHRGAPVLPAKTEAREALTPGKPKYVNMPAGYERRLNYHRHRIANDAAAKDERGGYRFPVHIKGPEQNVRAFHNDVISRFGVFPTTTSFAEGLGEIAFTYAGSLGPESLENLAMEHRLTVLQCGNPFTM